MTRRLLSIDTRVAVSVVVVALFAGTCLAAPSPRPIAMDDLSLVQAQLGQRPVDPLSPFHLSLAATFDDLSALARVPQTDRLQARDDVYLHASLRERSDELAGGVLPAPAGLRVLDGDLFFLQGGPGVVQASLLVEATATREGAITAIEDWLGRSDFEIVLPGSLNLVIGWRTPGGYLMGTFSDLSIFQLSAFPDEPSDLLAGSQIVLYEGLAEYSRGIADGQSESDLLPALERIVRWVEATRSILEPVNR